MVSYKNDPGSAFQKSPWPLQQRETHVFQQPTSVELNVIMLEHLRTYQRRCKQTVWTKIASANNIAAVRSGIEPDTICMHA